MRTCFLKTVHFRREKGYPAWPSAASASGRPRGQRWKWRVRGRKVDEELKKCSSYNVCSRQQENKENKDSNLGFALYFTYEEISPNATHARPYT